MSTAIYADFIFKSDSKDGLTSVDTSPSNLKDRNENYQLIVKQEFSNEETCLLLACDQRNSLVDALPEAETFLGRLENIRIGINSINDSGETALHIAASEGRVEVVRYLLERGFPPDIRTEDVCPNSEMHYRDTLQTPMHYAATGGHVEVLALLAGHGANISAVTESGDSPLHKAALHGQTAAARWLLDRGAKVRSENVFGASPLSMAMVNHRQDMVELLVNRGAAGFRNDTEVIGYTEVLLLLECSVLLILKLRVS